ncbi:MAG: glutamate racemase [Lachnospiraceae bacterium]|nr:glutamate racemase [Lachnospiraceae bacterium]
MDNRSGIGVFDSGVGGLTVAAEIMDQLPKEKIIYFGDTARVPYGGKSKETVTRYTEQIIRFLLSKDVKALVVACNTMSALALDTVEKGLSIPIIGVIKPGAKTAVNTTRNGKIGVIATESTINSGLYPGYIKELDSTVEVVGKACPLLCPLVEEGMIEDPVTDEMVRRYLAVLKEKEIDTLILGCTHYPLLKNTIGRIIGDKVNLVNPAYETANGLKELLLSKGLLNDDNEVKEHEFYVSDSAKKFSAFASTILHKKNIRAKTVNIE